MALQGQTVIRSSRLSAVIATTLRSWDECAFSLGHQRKGPDGQHIYDEVASLIKYPSAEFNVVDSGPVYPLVGRGK